MASEPDYAIVLDSENNVLETCCPTMKSSIKEGAIQNDEYNAILIIKYQNERKEILDEDCILDQIRYCPHCGKEIELYFAVGEEDNA